MKKLFLLLFLLIFNSLNCFSDKQIVQIAQQRYTQATPGFIATFNSPNYGRFFEMGSAVYAESKWGEEILGFDLDLTFLNLNGQKNYIPYRGNRYELRTTEFDVITSRYVFECKNSDKHTKIRQFEKEKIVLEWFRALIQEQDMGQLKVSFTFNSKGNSIITVNGSSTFNKDISITSKWVAGKTTEECRLQWTDIFNMLAEKELIVMFRNCCPGTKEKVKNNGISCKDRIDKKMDRLFEQGLSSKFRNMSLNYQTN